MVNCSLWVPSRSDKARHVKSGTGTLQGEGTHARRRKTMSGDVDGRGQSKCRGFEAGRRPLTGVDAGDTQQLYLLLVCSSKRFVPSGDGTEKAKNGLHPSPNPRAGKRIPLQQIPDEAAPDRNRAHVSPLRKTNQNLVPEP